MSAIAAMINPIPKTGASRTGTITADFRTLITILGMPNATALDDADKVGASWGFQHDDGREGFVWCYSTAPHQCREWSCTGDRSLLDELFGNDYVAH